MHGFGPEKYGSRLPLRFRRHRDLTRNVGSGDSEEPSAEISQHGEARVCIEPVPRRLRRPPEDWATRSCALSSLHRMGARPDDVVYGRRMYEIMRYWDDNQPDWDADNREFAAVWRSQRKWVASNSLTSVGPNATLIVDDFEAVIRRLKAQLDGEISVAGPNLAGRLTDVGLIDEYRLYVHPVVLGSGQPFFAGPRPRLRLVSSDRIGEAVIRLTYVPA